ncbi:unnamed protein product, partial [Rotaria sp. Silwood2]
EERARDHYRNLTEYGPRVINTRADYLTRAFILAELDRIRTSTNKPIRFEISLQNFSVAEIDQLQNIIVHISNTMPSSDTPCLMLAAHYDSGILDLIILIV